MFTSSRVVQDAGRFNLLLEAFEGLFQRLAFLDEHCGQNRFTSFRAHSRLSEAGAGYMLEKRGYERSGFPPATIGPGATRLLEVHCRLERLRDRIRRYGLSLWVQRRTAMALGLEGWRRRVLLQEHEITNRSLK